MDENLDKFKIKNFFGKKKNILIIAIVLLLLCLLFLFFLKEKDSYVIHITSGETINSISSELQDNNVINNASTFKFFLKILGKTNYISLGDYLIRKGAPVWEIAWQISRGNHNIQPIKITLREGLTNKQIAEILKIKINNFSENDFLTKTINKQGYLFPDTYFIFSGDTIDEIIEKLTNNFDNKIRDLSSDIITSGRNLKDIIIMASILEGEAGGKEDVGIISGILWKRLSIGMPLQVDVDKDTYDNRGLPDSPLNNPGLVSIEAAIYPKETSYLYYIHDKDGNVHFSKTFEEHKDNIKKYLNN